MEQTILPLKENTLYYEKTEPSRPSQAEVADYQVELTNEGQDLTLFAKETLDQLTKPAKLHFAERKPANYDQLDHPELDLASLDKAYDKLEREEASSFPELEFFGQMHGTYLFAQGRDGLYIIDQHAAQERVKYEEYRESIGNVDQSQQQLLVPYIFEFPADDALRLKERMALLEEVGVFLAEYGENQFILREHPIWMAEEEIESGIYEMCDMLLLTKEVSIKKYRAELAIMMSCKRSIKPIIVSMTIRPDNSSISSLNVTIPTTVPTDVLFWCISPSRIWKRCSDVFRKITPVSVSWGNIKLKGKLCTNI